MSWHSPFHTTWNKMSNFLLFQFCTLPARHPSVVYLYGKTLNFQVHTTYFMLWNVLKFSLLGLHSSSRLRLFFNERCYNWRWFQWRIFVWWWYDANIDPYLDNVNTYHHHLMAIFHRLRYLTWRSHYTFLLNIKLKTYSAR